MAPFIRNGDVVTISPLRGRRARFGDVVAFANSTDGLVVHRVVARGPGRYEIRADNPGGPDDIALRRPACSAPSPGSNASATACDSAWVPNGCWSGSSCGWGCCSGSSRSCARHGRRSRGTESSDDVVRGQHAAARVRPVERVRGQGHTRVVRDRADGALQQRLPALLHQPPGRRPRGTSRRAQLRRDLRLGRPGRRARRALVPAHGRRAPAAPRLLRHLPRSQEAGSAGLRLHQRVSDQARARRPFPPVSAA